MAFLHKRLGVFLALSAKKTFPIIIWRQIKLIWLKDVMQMHPNWTEASSQDCWTVSEGILIFALVSIVVLTLV